jgi:hypothetical protein
MIFAIVLVLGCLKASRTLRFRKNNNQTTFAELGRADETGAGPIQQSYLPLFVRKTKC